MFQAIYELAQATTLVLTVAASDDGCLVVNVCPKPGKGDTSNALSTPLQLRGTPAELDAEFASIVSGYTAARKSLKEQLDAARAVMTAASTQATDAAAKAVAKANKGKGVAAAAPETKVDPVGDDPEGDENEQAGGAAAGAPGKSAVPTPAQDQVQDSLFG